ncbi:hypothetical protein THIOSC15_3620001 [uncultured Thiomicrorhabdus sp.]
MRSIALAMVENANNEVTLQTKNSAVEPRKPLPNEELDARRGKSRQGLCKI